MKCPKCRQENPETKQFCADCGTKLTPPGTPQASFTRTLETTPDELVRGTLFAGRYEIIEELGGGGMGRVYRAHDTKLNEEVALKLIKPEIAADKRTVERFHNEIKSARKISHPNVCRTHDLGEDGKTLYLTMEYVRGEDLKSLIHRMRALTVGAAISVARQMAEGLGEAHKQGIVHRDLKPGNVMIDKDGNAKIMDFGIARSLQGGEITGEGAIIGTPEYMSPEQVEGKPADARADIYALGVILFEMVTGRVPFEGETPFSIANKHKTEPPPIPKKLVPQIPDGLSRLILKCLEKDKAKRFQTTEELIADLAAVEASLPTAERAPVGRPFTKSKPTLSRKITLELTPKKAIIPVLAVIGLVAAGILLLRILPHKTSAPGSVKLLNLAVLGFTNLTGNPAFDNYQNIQGLLTFALFPSKLINVFSDDQVFGLLNRLKLREVKQYSREDFEAMAKKGFIDVIVRGSIAKSGEGAIINLVVQKASGGEILVQETLLCRGDAELQNVTDELKQKVIQGLHFNPRQILADIDQSTGSITSTSPEALKFYFQGRSYFRDRDFEKSIECLKKAVEADPLFPMAYRALFASYFNLGRNGEGEPFLAKAFELSGRASRRERRIIQVHYTGQFKGMAQAQELCQGLLKDYPNDYFGVNTLGQFYIIQEEWEKASKLLEGFISQGTDDRAIYGLAATAELHLGNFEKARELLEYYAAKIDPLGFHENLRYVYAGLGNFDRALAEQEKNEKFTRNINHKFSGDMHLLKGDVAAAEAEYIKGDPSDGLAAHQWLFRFYFGQGKFEKGQQESQAILEWGQKIDDPFLIKDARLMRMAVDSQPDAAKEALEAVEEALGRADEINVERNKIWTFVELNRDKILALLILRSEAEAKKTLATYKKWLDRKIEFTGNWKLIRDYFDLQGRIAIEESKWDDAVDRFRQALATLSSEYYYWSDAGGASQNTAYVESLARAYFREGDWENARREYKKIAESRIERVRDLYPKSFYMLGLIAEKQGRKTEAREKYSKFLDLWKDADPGLPEVEDAKRRLAAL